MKKFAIVLMSILFSSLLTGCAYFTKPSFIQNRDKTYLNAKSAQPARIPPGVTPVAFTDSYPIPDKYYPNGAQAVSIVPPGLNS